MKVQLISSLLSFALPLVAAVPTFLGARDTDAAAAPDGETAGNWGQQVEVIYEFPKPSWVENLVVRPNGLILADLLSAPELWQVDPSSKSAALVHTFPSPYNGLLGITGYYQDTYYLITTNWNHQTLNVTPNEFAIWQVQMTGSGTGSNIKQLCTLNSGIFLNGIEQINQNTLLVADSRKGVVWKVDIPSASCNNIALDNALLKPTNPTSGLGVNGLKHDGSNYLYFSNSAQALLGRVPINSAGSATGAWQTLTTNAPIDDFVLRPGGGAYLCQNVVNEFAEVGPNYGTETVLINSANSTELLGPTAARFGRMNWDQNAVYVSSTGGIQAWATGQFKVGGRINRIWVGNWN